MSEAKDDKPETNEQRKPLRIDLNPKVEVQTSIGPVFLYEAENKTVNEYAQQPPGDALPKVRHYLGQIASTTQRQKWSDDHVPLTASQVQALTDDDIERMAEAYLKTLNSMYFIAKASKATPPIVREGGQSGTSFLDRLLVFRAKDVSDTWRQVAAAVDTTTKALVEQTFGRSAAALAGLQNQALGLSNLVTGARLQQRYLDELRQTEEKRQRVIEVEPSPAFDIMRREAEQRRRERQEELALTRGIQDISMRSAELLAEVSKTSTTILGQFGDFLRLFVDSNRRAAEGSRLGLWIAVGSLIATVIVTVIGVGVGYLSYQQDREINRSNDKWQQEVSQILKKQANLSEQSIRTLSAENAQLRRRLEVLEKTASAKNSKKSAPDQR